MYVVAACTSASGAYSLHYTTVQAGVTCTWAIKKFKSDLREE